MKKMPNSNKDVMKDMLSSMIQFSAKSIRIG